MNSHEPRPAHFLSRNLFASTVSIRSWKLLCLGLLCLGTTSAAAQAQQRPQQIQIGKLDGSGMKPLVELEGVTSQGSPAVSQDGRWMALDGWKSGDGETLRNSKIFLIDAKNRTHKVLMGGAMPSFSPKGERIAFSSPEKGGVWIVSRNGPEEELALIDDRGWGIDWSPTGNQLVYAKYEDNGHNFTVIDIVEGTSHKIFEEGQSPYTSLHWNAAWSPDGKQIVFKGQRKGGGLEVAVVDARGAEHGWQTLLEENTTPQYGWSLDGKQIVIVKPDPKRKVSALYLLSATEPGKLEILPGLDPDLEYVAGIYTHDGKELITVTRITAEAAKKAAEAEKTAEATKKATDAKADKEAKAKPATEKSATEKSDPKQPAAEKAE